MNLELIDNRKEVFARPKTKEQVAKGRKPVKIEKFSDILPAGEYRRKDEFLWLLPQVELIPGQARGDITPYKNAVNFSKRGPLVEIRTFSREVAIAKQWGDLMARIDACERYKDRTNELFVGLVWKDLEGYAHVYHPTTVVEGHRLFMYGVKSGNIQDKTAVMAPGVKKDYTARDTNLRNVRVIVPSRSEEVKREVVIEHVTSPNDPERFVEWPRIRTRHDCPLKQEDFSFRFPHYVTYCPHDVAAFAALSKKFAEEHGKVLNQPFFLFSEPLLRLHMTLAYHTVKTETIVDGDNIRYRTRPLSFAEINPILINAWIRYGNKSTFYAHKPTQSYKKMRDYNWSVDEPGMPFIDKIKR